jgi:hypothetical protein
LATLSFFRNPNFKSAIITIANSNSLRPLVLEKVGRSQVDQRLSNRPLSVSASNRRPFFPSQATLTNPTSFSSPSFSIHNRLFVTSQNTDRHGSDISHF